MLDFVPSWVPYGPIAAYFRRTIRNLRNCSPLGRTSQGGCTDQGAAATAEAVGNIVGAPWRDCYQGRTTKPNESFGDFDQAVNAAIAKLRGALGDAADNPRYIETLPRRGYRFIADVAVVNRPIDKMEFVHAGASSGKEDRAPHEVAGKVAPKRLAWQHAWKTLGLALVLLILIVWIFRWRSRPPGNVLSSSSVRSLAVLPLENLSSNSEDYFADGMTDELITDLAQISALRVISRTSVMPYKGVRKPLP